MNTLFRIDFASDSGPVCLQCRVGTIYAYCVRGETLIAKCIGCNALEYFRADPAPTDVHAAVSYHKAGREQAAVQQAQDEVQCQDCRWTGSESQLKEIRHLHERVAPGEVMPVGECPKCGALAHYKRLNKRNHS